MVTVGQKVWVESYSYWRKREYKEAVVSKVGRKYFYLEGREREKYDLTTLRDVSDQGYSSIVHLSLQDISDKEEHAALLECIKNEFHRHSSRRYTLDQLRKIAEIIHCEE